MKQFKITTAIMFVALLLLPVVVFAANGSAKGIHEAGTGIENPELKEAGQGTGQGEAAQVMLMNEGEEQQNQMKKGMEDEDGEEVEEDTAAGNGQVSVNRKSADKGRGDLRRSRVATAVQEMIRIAEKNEGIGEQVRVVARNQNQNFDEMESAMDAVKNRGRLKKFFLGPDYKNLKTVEEKLAQHDEKVAELKSIIGQVTDDNMADTLQQQLDAMEAARDELETEMTAEGKGFSLFGWLSKMLVK